MVHNETMSTIDTTDGLKTSTTSDSIRPAHKQNSNNKRKSIIPSVIHKTESSYFSSIRDRLNYIFVDFVLWPAKLLG